MSISSRTARASAGKGKPSGDADDFSLWLGETFGAQGKFTALIVLVSIGETRVTPLASTFLTFVGPEVTWTELAGLFAGARKPWDGASFFPVLDAGGPLANGEARARLRSLEHRLAQDRLVLNEGAFFDLFGRRLEVKEITPH